MAEKQETLTAAQKLALVTHIFMSKEIGIVGLDWKDKAVYIRALLDCISIIDSWPESE